MFFLHRQNNLEPQIYEGVEIDVRSVYGEIYINHDRLTQAEKYILFNSYIENIANQKPISIIVNVKESGLEEEILEIFKMNDLFEKGFKLYFLDSQIPDIIRLSRNNEFKGKFIIRVSDMESFNINLIKLARPDYIWVDFSQMNELTKNIETYENMLNYIIDSISLSKVFKIKEPTLMFVSPELYSLDNFKHINVIIDLIKTKRINNFKICTKDPMRWITKGIDV